MTFPLDFYTSGHPPGATVLLYAGSCPKCRFLSRCIAVWSFGRVKRVPLEIPQWRKLYDEHLPEARGYPVLVLEDGPVFGPRVFWIVPLVVFKSWVLPPLQWIRGVLKRERVAKEQKP